MTIKIIDAAFETTTTTGTGDITLAGALSGFRPFSSAGNNAFVAYQINDGNAAGVITQREVGIGQVVVGTPNVLKRLKILYSTNGNAAVNFGTGTKNVLGSIPADILATRDENLNFIEGVGIGNGTAGAHIVTLPTAPLGYSDGMRVMYYPAIANAGAFTVNVNNLGNKSVKFAGIDPVAGIASPLTMLPLVYNAATGFFDIQPTGAMVATGPVGQCRLIRSGASLVLNPYQGNRLTVGGLPQAIPAGLALAATGLAATTLYYIYAYMNGATMVLEASTTGHSTDAASGVEIKTGDASRTLVGMGFTAAAATWGTGNADVASWFNRRPVTVRGGFTATRNLTSTSLIEINLEARCTFLSWGDTVQAAFNGAVGNGTQAQNTTTQIVLNGNAAFDAQTMQQPATYTPAMCCISSSVESPEGRNYVAIFGAVTGGTGNWYGTNVYTASGKSSATVWI